MVGNKVSTQNSEMKELPYTEKLTRDIHIEKEKLSLLSPQICYYELQCAMVEKQNREMKLLVEALQNERARKEAEFRALKEELEKLSQDLKAATTSK